MARVSNAVIPVRRPLHQLDVVRHPHHRSAVAGEQDDGELAKHRVDTSAREPSPRGPSARGALLAWRDARGGRADARSRRLRCRVASTGGAPRPTRQSEERTMPVSMFIAGYPIPGPRSSSSPASSRSRPRRTTRKRVRPTGPRVRARHPGTRGDDLGSGRPADEGARRAPRGPPRGARRPGTRRPGLARGVPRAVTSFEGTGIGRDDG